MDSSQDNPGSSKSQAVKSDASPYSRLPHLANCVLCKTEQHSTWDCILEPSDKMARIKQLCLNCLVPDHKTCDCPNAELKCKDCGLQHCESLIYDIIYRKVDGWYFDPAKGTYQPTNSTTSLDNEQDLDEDKNELVIDLSAAEDTPDLKQLLEDSMTKKIFFD